MSDFIPKQPKYEQFTIRIDSEKLEKLHKLAASYHLSHSALINQCI